MPKKKKLGLTERWARYYHMAKEQGYRSRAAYKLIQLNQKYNFLANAHTVIDLCAAPGSWLQVATKYMPLSRNLVGIDLVPIKPIPNVTTFAEDITTAKCRAILKKTLKDAKAEVVLHDGAPNVGVSWVQDAFSQAELALSATKLATEFLAPGGTYVTKVFRSAEYTKLLWVLHQLFRKVIPTKPQASRGVSAEIFVVCQGYLAPKTIDPKLLDAKFVFKDIDLPQAAPNIFLDKPNKKTKIAYGEGKAMIYSEVPVAEFIESHDPVTMLAEHNKFVFDDQSQKYEERPETTTEIKACLADLKVLNKKDFRGILKWRQKLIAYFKAKEDEEAQKDGEESGEESSGEDLTPEELEALRLGELDEAEARVVRAARRKEKKKREAKVKQRKRLAHQMDMVDEFDAPGAASDALFGLARIKHPKLLTTLDKHDQPNVTAEDVASEDSMEDEEKDKLIFTTEEGYREYLEDELDSMYQQYAKRRKIRPQKPADESSKYEGQADDEEVSEDDEDLEIKEEDLQNGTTESLLMKDMKAQPTPTQRTAMWFDQDLFKEVLDEDLDEKVEMEKLMASKKRKVSENESISIKAEEVEMKVEPKELVEPSDDEDGASDDEQNGENDDDDDDMSEGDGDSFDEVAMEPMEGEDEMNDSDYEDEEKAQIMAIAKKMANKHDRAKIINQTFNRFAFSDTPDLPWFKDDQYKHSRPALPVTEEEVDEMKNKLKGIDVKTTKKMLEAKARKKKKMVKQMDKAKSRAAGVFLSEELTPQEKARELAKIYRTAKQQKRPNKVYVAGGKLMGNRTKGSRLRFVDKRMKKDRRAEKAQKKRKRS